MTKETAYLALCFKMRTDGPIRSIVEEMIAESERSIDVLKPMVEQFNNAVQQHVKEIGDLIELKDQFAHRKEEVIAIMKSCQTSEPPN